MRNKKIKKRMKQYSRYEFSTKEYIAYKYQKEGECVIVLDLSKIDDFIEPYSKSQPILKQDIGQYIERVAYDIPTYIPISIQLTGRFNQQEQELIKKLINSYFGLKVGDLMIDLRRNIIKSLILLLTGVLVLGIFVFLSYQKVDYILLEIFSITGSFAIWEFVNSIWLERNKMRIDRMNAGQLATAKFIFLEK